MFFASQQTLSLMLFYRETRSNQHVEPKSYRKVEIIQQDVLKNQIKMLSIYR